MPSRRMARAIACHQPSVAAAASGRSYIGRLARLIAGETASVRGSAGHRSGKAIEPVGDLVIVAAMVDEDMSYRLQSRWRVQGAGGDADAVAFEALPEQAGAAFAAKAAPRSFRRHKPFQVGAPDDGDVLVLRIGVGAEMAMELAALAAMAIPDRSQLAPYFIFDCTAKTPTRCPYPGGLRRLGFTLGHGA